MLDRQTGKGFDPDQGPGRRLRAAREGLGLSTKEVANRLHLDIKHIEAIERDDFDGLLEPVFVRGYLRSYARLVRLPPDAIVDSYRPQEADTPTVLPDLPATPRVHGGDRPMRWIIFLIILGLITLPVIWWQTRESWRFWEGESEANPGAQALAQHQAALSGTSAPSTPATKPDSESPAALPGETGGLTPTTTPSPLAADASSGPLSSLAPEAKRAESHPNSAPLTEQASTGAPSGEAKPANSSPALTLRLTNDAWVEVSDGTGKRLVYKLLQGGTTKTLEGVTPPLRVILGNASAVSVEYNGQPFDHSSYDHNGVARFVLGEPGNGSSDTRDKQE